jgi:hypothetical protein
VTTKTRTEPEPTPVSTPVEDLPIPEPTAPADPSVEEGLPPTGAFHLGSEGAVPIPAEEVARLIAADPTPAGDLRDDHPLSAAEALAEVFRRVRPIAKGRTAEPKAGGYAFRGIDDVYAALHDLFAEVGLVMLPSTLDREREQRPRASGSGYNYVTHVHVRLRFLAADGSSEELDGWGEGADSGDKSTGKAYSQAIKSALLAAFLIPTEASAADDPDRSNTEPSRPVTAEEHERAERALAAAQATNTVEELAGVRHRALALLDVPVRFANGSTTPLGYLFDEQRRRIESAGSSS